MATTRQDARARPARRRPPAPSAAALVILGYAVLVYAAFLAVLGYAIGFFADAGVPKGIDGGPRSPWPLAVAVDLLLLLLFAAQHTVMARPWFKRRWTRLVPAPAERATFVLCANLLLALLFWQWRPIGGTVWHLRGPAAGALIALYAIGWAVAVSSTFMIDHFDLFGPRQAYLHARGAAYRPPPFTERALFRWVRHPLMAGFVIIFWAAPVMTAGHLLFAAAATGYILLGIRFEERDLGRDLGGAYHAYRRRVPALIPALRTRPRRSTPSQGGHTA
jgi:protein-S-isoprenylcysteine O-methyltransferase Ste14